MTNRLRELFGSVSTKIMMIVAAMAAMIVASILVGVLVFRTVSDHVDQLVTEQVPALQQGSRVIADTTVLDQALSNTLLTGDPADLLQQSNAATAALRQLDHDVKTLPGGAGDNLHRMIAEAQKRFDDMARARNEEFTQTAKIEHDMAELDRQSTEIGKKLGEVADSAIFDLTLSSEDTVGKITSTLDKLVDRDFAAVELVLKLRAQVNLLTGVVISLSETQDDGMRAILRDLAVSSQERLDGLLPEIATNATLRPLAAALTAANALFAGIIAQNGPTGPAKARDILSSRQNIDAQLASMQDDLSFTMKLATGATAKANSEAVDALVSGGIERLRRLSALDVSAKRLTESALEAALARDEAGLKIAQDRLTSDAAHLSYDMPSVSADVQEKIRALLGFADPKTGMVATRRAVLKAHQAATEASSTARANSEAISAVARRVGGEALTTILTTGNGMLETVAASRMKLTLIAAISLLIVIGAPLFAYASIVRPLGRVTNVTRRLAAGEIEAVDRLGRNRGEIGRMAEALSIFRDGLVVKARLESEERENQQARAEAQAAAQRQSEESAEQERHRQEEQARVERERAAAEEARTTHLREIAEAERQARLQSQNAVVSALAGALGKLAEGDLRACIDGAFDEGYEQLRRDFNATVSILEEVMRSMRGSVESINSSSDDIARASGDLSSRSEATAATLEVTAGSIAELTALVNSAAVRAGEADAAVEAARARAASSTEVLRGTVAAMGAIEESSRRIAAIIGVIEDIAFQTNLLALNAGVEAARAGDAGRGFAVVASEVRALSARSSEAAREIAHLIENSGGEVTRGVDMVGQVEVTLKDIVASISTITGHVSAIAAATREQSAGITGVNASISKLNHATQQNAAMAEETTAAGQILLRDASALSQTVSRFQVHDGRRAALPGAPVVVTPSRRGQEEGNRGPATPGKTCPSSGGSVYGGEWQMRHSARSSAPDGPFGKRATRTEDSPVPPAGATTEGELVRRAPGVEAAPRERPD